MIDYPNYSKQTKGLPVQNSFQIMQLWWTDNFIALRETTKCGAVVGLVVSASSGVFNFDPSSVFTCTAICGITWFLSRACCQKLEPEAKSMIKYFHDLKSGNDNIDVKEAKELGLID